MRVLIVDDSKTARMLCSRALPAGFASEVVEAPGGAEAIEICKTSQVDLLLLDLTMPVVDGFHVLEALTQLSARPKAIVMSADVQPKAQERVKELGALGFIAKPANAQALDAMLRKLGLL